MKKVFSLLVLLIFTTACLAQTQRDPDDTGAPTERTEEEANQMFEACNNASQSAHMQFQSAESSIAWLELQAVEDDNDGHYTIAEKWREYEGDGFVIPQWCLESFADITIVAPSALTGQLYDPAPLGYGCYTSLAVADEEKQDGDTAYNFGDWTDSYNHHYRAVHGTDLTIVGYNAVKDAAELVYEDAGDEVADLFDIDYYVEQEYWYWFYYGG